MSKEHVLKVENVTMQFGGVIAVDNMNLEVNKGEIISLIGPNGAGKTTAFNVITGVYAPTNGAVYFKDHKIIQNHPQGKMKKLYQGENAREYAGQHVMAPTPDKITKLGIARTFQNIRLFKSQTVKIFSLPNICCAPAIFLRLPSGSMPGRRQRCGRRRRSS